VRAAAGLRAEGAVAFCRWAREQFAWSVPRMERLELLSWPVETPLTDRAVLRGRVVLT